jgi:hypothetical protein
MFRVVKKGSGCRNSWVEMGEDKRRGIRRK